MTQTILVPGVAWPEFTPPSPRVKAPPSPIMNGVQRKIIEHLEIHNIACATSMLAAGVAKKSEAITRNVNKLLDVGVVKHVVPDNSNGHHLAKYYSLVKL